MQKVSFRHAKDNLSETVHGLGEESYGFGLTGNKHSLNTSKGA